MGNSENVIMILIYMLLTVYLLLACQELLSRLVISVQHLFQLDQLNLFGMAYLNDLLSPQRRKIDNSFNRRMLSLIL